MVMPPIDITFNVIPDKYINANVANIDVGIDTPIINDVVGFLKNKKRAPQGGGTP